MQVLYDSDGPWHEGYAVSTDVMGCYVTIVASSPDVATAIAQLLGHPATASTDPQRAMVGRIPREVQPKRRQ